MYFLKTELPKMKSFHLEQKADTVSPCNHRVGVLSTGQEGGNVDRRMRETVECLVLSWWQCAVVVTLTHL